MPEPINRMSKIVTEEVSLVKRAANKKTFAVAKSEQTGKRDWDTQYVNDLPDSAFLYIESGGEKDDTGRTEPRSKRHFPVRNANGSLDMPHIRNAIARLPQSNAPGLSLHDKQKLQDKARKILQDESTTKSEESMKTDGLIEAVASTAAEGEAAFVASLKSRGITDEKKLAAMVANFRVAKNFSDLISKEEMVEVQKAAGYDTAVKLAQMCDEMKALTQSMIGDTEPPSDVPNAVEDQKPEDEMTTQKSLSANDIAKIVRDTVASELDKRDGEQVKKHQSLETLMKEILSKNDEQKFVSKAEKDFRFLPASKEEIATTLKSAYAVSPENGQAVETILGRANDALAQSPSFKSFGSSGHRAGSGGSDALSKAEALVNEVVKKSADVKMTKEKARGLVWKSEEGKKLYEEYLDEHPAQRARYAHER